MGTQCCHRSPTRKAVSLLSISPARTSIFTFVTLLITVGSILFLSKVNPFRFLISSHGFHSYIGQVNLSPISLPLAHKHIPEPYYLLKYLLLTPYPYTAIPEFLCSLHSKTSHVVYVCCLCPHVPIHSSTHSGHVHISDSPTRIKPRLPMIFFSDLQAMSLAHVYPSAALNN